MNKPPNELLWQWYVKEKRSYRWIMSQIGSKSARAIRKLLMDAGIDIRHGGEAVATQWINNTERRNKASKIAQEKFAPFRGKLSKIPETRKKISDSKKGEKNPMWGLRAEKHHHFLGGKKTWRFGRKLRKSKRAEIINQLGGKCFRCKTDKNLTLNHKIPWREVRHHELWNLEILCRKCHFSGPNRLR